MEFFIAIDLLVLLVFVASLVVLVLQKMGIVPPNWPFQNKSQEHAPIGRPVRNAAQEEEQVAAVVEAAKPHLAERLSYLRDRLLAEGHDFTAAELEQYKAETKQLHEQLEYLNQQHALNRLGYDAILLYSLLCNLDELRTAHNKAVTR